MNDENVFHIPSGCKNAEEFSNYVHSKIMECLKDYKSKDATLKHLLDEYQIEHDQTNTVWDLLEIAYADFFIEYEKNRKTRENDATSSTKGIEPGFF
ncbi:unnamed protein product [Arabis nemorensis]|uniref:Uncharacterized protein n=1 Tax=Arabis nemorensis TaxID=586526 RepID=A0A565BQW7_9BRAS|nr:unnamed protein product [Arabis nemorensis]